MGGGDASMPGSQTAGVKPMSITGRMVRERERLQGMSAEERAWRKKWLKDQVLSPQEPRYVKALEKEMLNPIRRAYRAPLDFIFYRILQPRIGRDAAEVFRFYTGRAALITAGIYATWYLLKYNGNDWTKRGGWRIIKARQAIYPGDPGYGEPIEEKLPNDYYDRGFKKSVFNSPAILKDSRNQCD